MRERDVLWILDALKGAGVPCVIGGGWGVDALVGHQTRRHHDPGSGVVGVRAGRATGAGDPDSSGVRAAEPVTCLHPMDAFPVGDGRRRRALHRPGQPRSCAASRPCWVTVNRSGISPPTTAIRPSSSPGSSGADWWRACRRRRSSCSIPASICEPTTSTRDVRLLRNTLCARHVPRASVGLGVRWDPRARTEPRTRTVETEPVTEQTESGLSDMGPAGLRLGRHFERSNSGRRRANEADHAGKTLPDAAQSRTGADSSKTRPMPVPNAPLWGVDPGPTRAQMNDW